MTFEVELMRDDAGRYHAAAVAYPGITASGRTEKEALGFLMHALERHLKQEARKRREARSGR